MDANLLQLFEDGRELESYAERRFEEVRTFEGDLEPGVVYRQVKFLSGDFECTADLVRVESDGSLVLTEIKSSTKVKDSQVEDLAFQRLVAEDAGYQVSGTTVLHINNAYILEGEIDPMGLFTETDVAEGVEAKLPEVRSQRNDAVLVALATKAPDLSPRYCLDNDTKKEWLRVLRQFREIPEASIYELPYLTLSQVGELEDQGVILIADIPDNYKLRKDQERLRAALQANETVIDRAGWTEFVASLQYPLSFLDYESLALSVPAFQGTKPYQQITFQFSLHVLNSPTSELGHVEYIHPDSSHPFRPLATALRKSIGATGSVIVWNETFEKGRNKELAEAVPELAEFLLGLNDRMVDLMKPFKEGLYDDPKFLGSASIKKVLPVLVDDLSYKELEVQEGRTASRIWRQEILEGSHDGQKRNDAIKNLAQYCELDTLAMVKILAAVMDLAE